ncbi:hypothetical protein CF319_g2890 [Tilletia indica]|nr:hypothetical protein CF319_g2890 [Tilletia indica]
MVLSGSGLGRIVDICNSINPFRSDHVFFQGLSSFGLPPNERPDEEDGTFFRLLHHSPGLLAQVWENSSQIHRVEASETSTRFLTRLDAIFTDIRSGRASLADVYLYLDLLENAVRDTASPSNPSSSASLSEEGTLDDFGTRVLALLQQFRDEVSACSDVETVTLFRAAPPNSEQLTAEDVNSRRLSLLNLAVGLDTEWAVRGPFAEDNPCVAPGALASKDEIASYLTGRFCWLEHHTNDSSASALSWWASHSSSLPRLAILARTYLAIPAGTSSLVDSTFAVAKKFRNTGFEVYSLDRLTHIHSLLNRGVAVVDLNLDSDSDSDS